MALNFYERKHQEYLLDKEKREKELEKNREAMRVKLNEKAPHLLEFIEELKKLTGEQVIVKGLKFYE